MMLNLPALPNVLFHSASFQPTSPSPNLSSPTAQKGSEGVRISFSRTVFLCLVSLHPFPSFSWSIPLFHALSFTTRLIIIIILLLFLLHPTSLSSNVISWGPSHSRTNNPGDERRRIHFGNLLCLSEGYRRWGMTQLFQCCCVE